MEGENRFYLAALARSAGLGARRLSALLSECPDARALWEMETGELAALGNLPAGVADALARLRRSLPHLPEQLARACEACGARLVVMEDSEYPYILKEIFDPPMVLYVRGRLAQVPRVAVVGARKLSGYGEALALDFGEKLAAAGLTVVSGGARGIDTRAHRGALRAEGGRTVAVLGCGIDVAYPAENRRLLAEIAERGAVVSEYAPGTQPLPAFFPARNRIISGLAAGTLVVEAARRSGSLITAELALSEGREVYAVPGSVLSATSEGCHHLIQQGAKLVTRAQDILEDYGIEPVPRKKASPKLTAEERRVYQVLSFDHPLSVDEILMSLPDGEMPNLALLLLQMEMKGAVIETEWHAYRRAERE